MKKKEILAVFKDFDQVTGIEGTQLEFYLQDFKRFVEQLASHEKVSITHLTIHPTNPDVLSRLELLERHHKITIDQEIKSFYQQAASIQLRWIHKDHPNYNSQSDAQFTGKPFTSDLIEQEMGSARYINITHGDFFLERWPFVHLPFKDEEGFELFYFNYDHHFAGQMAHNLNRAKGVLEMYTGDDCFADCRRMQIDFPTYMKRLITYDETKVTEAAFE